MQDISSKGTRWTFEDNKEEDIKDDAQYTVYPAQRDMVNRNNITVSCGDYERPIQCVVLNWEENYNELGSIGAANTVQKMYICPIEFRGSSKMLKIVAKVPKIVAKLLKLLRKCLI